MLKHALTILLALGPTIALGQNTGGVFGPEVTPDSRALEARVAVVPGSDGRDRRFASRIHYQDAVTDNLRLRAVVQGVDTSANGFDLDFIQFEAQLQFREDELHGWDSAVRFDVQIAEDRADLFGVNWTSDLYLNNRWSLRGVLLAAGQFGSERSNGTFLQTRTSVSYKLESNYKVQMQMFNNYGKSAEFADFEDQSHAIGPGISGRLGSGWSFEASVLFGITDATDDADLRVFLTKAL